MTQPLVTIVTPSFNQASYLEQTIQSVLSQKYSSIEYFIMDGGSDDGSKSIIMKYKEKLAGWVSEPDGGQADGINKGFARASGSICGWINSDDYYLPGAIESATNFLIKHPQVDLVYGDAISIDGAGKMINVMKFSPYSLEDLMTFRIICQPAVFFRRKIWNESGGLNLTLRFLLDHELWLKMASKGKIAYFPQPWACARFYPEAKNRAYASDFGEEAYRLAAWMVTDDKFKSQSVRMKNKIFGGAAWLDAHYLSESGQFAKSLHAYRKAMHLFPSRVWEDRRRFLLTILASINPQAAQKVFTKKSSKRLADLQDYQKYLNVSK